MPDVAECKEIRCIYHREHFPDEPEIRPRRDFYLSYLRKKFYVCIRCRLRQAPIYTKRKMDRIEARIGTRRVMPNWEIKLIEDAQRVALMPEDENAMRE